jgi:hypothetical protein
MVESTEKLFAKGSVGLVLFIVCLSLLFRVPYIFGLLALLVWSLVGMFVIGDFHALGAMPAKEAKRFIVGVMLLLVALTSVVCLIVLVPEIRTYGG